MKNQNKGYTVTELLLAAGLSSIVLMSTVSLLFYFFNEKNQLDTWSAGQLEMSIGIKSIESDLRNIVRLDPPEDLRITKDSLYFGLTNIPPGEEPSICRNDENSSVLRYTSLNRDARQERTMRTWSEKDSVDKIGAINELRATTDSTSDTLFTDKNLPKEIVLVDADRRYIRRYQVASRVMHLNSDKDPYDDQPKVDANGIPIFFNYASLFLKTSTGIKANSTSIESAVFITGSDVYKSSTLFVCLRKSDGSLIKYNSLTNQSDVLLLNNSQEFSITAFKATYLNTRKDVRVDPINFFPSILANTKGHCVNAIHVLLKAEVTKGQNSDVENRNIQPDIIRERTIFATNLSSQRAINCFQ